MTYLVDTRTSRVGELIGHDDHRLVLKPLGGGREWRCPPGCTRDPTTAERVHAAVTAANARSTGGRGWG